MHILIPAYMPDERLPELILQLKAESDDPILIVDDGSGPSCAAVFDRVTSLGCRVIRLDTNRGKGYALRVGLAAIKEEGETEGVVCADCDGQHRAEDIRKLADDLRTGEPGILLGSRSFTGKVPARSRAGNRFTSISFYLATGRYLKDTQTGLRGYPADLLPFLLRVRGDRYEYELNLLLDAASAGIPIRELPIATVYLDGNRSSHFRPLADSVRVYLPILRFGISSAAGAVVDWAGVLLLFRQTDNLFLSVCLSRVASATVNFLINRYYVFGKSGKYRTASSALRYFLLAALILACNYAMLFFLTEILPIPIVPAKLITETLLFFASYFLQRSVVFAPRILAKNKGH